MFVRNFKKYAKKYVKLPRESSTCHGSNSFMIGDRQIENLRLLQRKNSDTLGKVGMLSWVGLMGNFSVKVYECRSVEQAKFIEKLSSDERIARYLPRCYYRKNEFLVVEWVEGKKVTWTDLAENQELMSKMSSIHIAFHSTSTDYWPDEKCYFFDYLESRFSRFRNVLPVDDFVDRVFSIIRDKLPPGETRLSHPDITPVNVVVDNVSGAMKVIDNDLFTQTSYYLIDLFTTHRSIGQGNSSDILLKYLEQYIQKGGDLSPLVKNEEFYNALWTYRLVGTCLQEGMIQQGLDLARKYLRNAMPPHPVIDTVKSGLLG